MAWYKIGNKVFSDMEVRADSGEFMNIAIPSVVTAVGVYFLLELIGSLPFFITHTTTAKLIYVLCGFLMFCVSYAYRKLIVALTIVGILGGALLLLAFVFWHWLVA